MIAGVLAGCAPGLRQRMGEETLDAPTLSGPEAPNYCENDKIQLLENTINGNKHGKSAYDRLANMITVQPGGIETTRATGPYIGATGQKEGTYSVAASGVSSHSVPRELILTVRVDDPKPDQVGYISISWVREDLEKVLVGSGADKGKIFQWDASRYGSRNYTKSDQQRASDIAEIVATYVEQGWLTQAKAELEACAPKDDAIDTFLGMGSRDSTPKPVSPVKNQ